MIGGLKMQDKLNQIESELNDLKRISAIDMLNAKEKISKVIDQTLQILREQNARLERVEQLYKNVELYKNENS